ncbi:MAG: iron ABC transporter permease [Burkholderiaceae bacterium]
MTTTATPKENTRLPIVLTVALLIAVLVLIIAYAWGAGSYGLSYSQMLDALIARAQGLPAPDPQIDAVLFKIRLPRIAAALLVGAALAVAGTVYQGLFRNPLVSPDILGVSAGAGLGAVGAILFGQPAPVIQLFAFLGGITTVTLVYWVAKSVRHHEPTLVLVLSGVVLGALAGALISLVKVLADPYNQLPSITYWLLGSLNGVSGQTVLTVLPAICLGLVPLVLLRWRMNLMSVGEDEAAAMGLSTARMRIIFIVAATLITSAAVAIAGIVGWIGLVIPHIARLLVGPDFTRLLPVALILGAAYLLLVDTLARSLAVVEAPLGVLTALLGAPVFIYLLFNGRRGW